MAIGFCPIHHISRIAVVIAALSCWTLFSEPAKADPCAPISDSSAEYIAKTSLLKVTARSGSLVYAMDNGSVEEKNADCISIMHKEGSVEYCGLNAIPDNVRKNAVIKQGQILGIVGQGMEINLRSDKYDLKRVDSNYECPCIPDCAGKSCGSDGCGESCGKCADGLYCLAGTCTCTPQLFIPDTEDEEKECGDDGCGNTLEKTCESGKSCQDYRCVSVKKCTPTCNNGNSDIYECGNDGCGGSCGNCAPGKYCLNHRCVCKDGCNGRQCGTNSCGDSCGECPSNFTCNPTTGQCQCLDTSFEISESACNDLTCGEEEPECGITCHCEASSPNNYAPSCGELSCGEIDIYGGKCAGCPEGLSCQIARGCLIPPQNCEPSCEDRQCGDNGCGGTCGLCGKGYHCDDYRCVSGNDSKIAFDNPSACQGNPRNSSGPLGMMLFLLCFAGMMIRRAVSVRMK